MQGSVDDGLGGGNEHVEKLMREDFFDSNTGNLKEAGAGGVSHASTLNLVLLQSLSLPSHHQPPCKPRYMGTTAKIMNLGGFEIVYMIHSGEIRPELLELYGGSVLCLPLDTHW